MTGVTLPLVSYGGSSLLCTILMLAIIQGLYILREDEDEEFENENRKQYRDSGQEKQLTERARSKKRRRRNKGYTGVSFFLSLYLWD